MIVNPPPHALQRVRAAASLVLRNVAVWTDQAMDYTTGLSKYFKERFAEFGGKIAHEDSYMTSDADFSAQASRLNRQATWTACSPPPVLIPPAPS